MENNNNEKQEQHVSSISHWLPIGMCLGCSFGLLLDNLALGISIGMLFGVALGTLFDHGKKKKPHDDASESEENPE